MTELLAGDGYYKVSISTTEVSWRWLLQGKYVRRLVSSKDLLLLLLLLLLTTARRDPFTTATTYYHPLLLPPTTTPHYHPLPLPAVRPSSALPSRWQRAHEGYLLTLTP
jgi:hypothetical protein